jgi:ribosomal protein S12 methylthiotransferase
MKIHVISLGCPRNLVDTENMLGLLQSQQHVITADPADADCVVVNTCGFIRPAVEESIDAVLEMTEWKKEVPGRRLVVVGCLPERYRQDLADSIPEVDVFLGTGAFERIGEAVAGELDPVGLALPAPKPLAGFKKLPARVQTGPPHTAYLKIAEGCSGRCTYCIIPKLRGRQHSRPMSDVLAEAQGLVDAGVKECILVAQNTTAYGHDLDRGYRLKDLLVKLAAIRGLSWIRVLYGHPDFMEDSLLETMRDYERICPYFDVPVQHISPSVLRRMGRNDDGKHIVNLFHRIRSKVPNAAIRTTVIVGFPGEKEKDFKRLLDFMEAVRFDHLGAFAYSDDEDLPSHQFKNHVPEEVKRQRYDQVMSFQAGLSAENNKKYVGKMLQVLIDEKDDYKGIITGRTGFQAPEIDGLVYVRGNCEQGCFVNVRVTQADEYDLTGQIVT